MQNTFLFRRLAWLLGLVLLGGCAGSKSGAPKNFLKDKSEAYFQNLDHGMMLPVVGHKGMVVADDPIAAEWGAEVLRRGGNAMDAAVATAFAMSVTRPHYTALGAGGFSVFCPAPVGGLRTNCYSMDFREKAPMAAFEDMYIKDGKPTRNSVNGPLASGVPGLVDGLLKNLKEYGTLSRKKVLTYPIRLAERGTPVATTLEYSIDLRWKIMNEASKRLFTCKHKGKKQPCRAGDKLIQKDLAGVLRAISEKGRSGFYDGWVAKKISQENQKAGGMITLEDLKSYESVIRKPVSGGFAGYEVVSMGPPSSGGTILLQLLKMTEHAHSEGLLNEGYGSPETIHAMSHAMSIAFADRTKHFGDPDHVYVPVAELIRPSYLMKRWKDTFRRGKANLPEGPGKIEKLLAFKDEPTETTHLSVVDSAGNAVSMTLTMNYFLGSGEVISGTGIAMNNQMNDFTIRPGVPNIYGLVGTKTNAVAPLRRPLSSMSPTVVRDNKGQVRFVVGVQGGPRIISTAYQILVNRLIFGMSMSDSVQAARFHHQWRPKAIFFENHGFSEFQRNELREMGWEVSEKRRNIGRSHNLERFSNGVVHGVADFRTEGAAARE